MRLEQLCRDLPDAEVPQAAAQLEIRAVRGDSRAVEPGDLFVAVPGEAEDGAAFVRDAVAGGAVAVVAESALDSPVPVIRVPDARAALAVLAAESLGRPAESLQLLGITGTLGKTSVLTMIEAILHEASIPVGTVGSLGIHYGDQQDTTPNTTPGADKLQEAMADMVADGTRVMAMEVTSHALMQGRVHGLTYDVGVFTNLTMLEHMEYHGSFAAYAAAKLRFLEHLKRDAPLIYAAGDRAVRAAACRHRGGLISVGGGNALVTVRRNSMSLDGTGITLSVRRPLRRLKMDALSPISFGVRLSTLGRTNINNASIAAAAALCLGADPGSVSSALANMRPPRRRLEVLQRSGPVIIDDTVGHPDSITGVFEVVQRVRHRRLHILFCVRGQRGPIINQRDAEALAIWSRAVPVHSLITTDAADTADERNAVTDEERRAFLGVIEASGLAHRHHARLKDALTDVMDEADANDLVLLLGAQGMDAGAELLRETGRIRGPSPDPAAGSVTGGSS
jgi:UDP-N-acetylmuramoyl-L-alanyl-D-glutamate--2,6-diaminopimelate ligase